MNPKTPFAKLRARHGYHTQRELATKVPCSQVTVYRLDHGRVPRERLLDRLAVLLKSTARKVRNTIEASR